MHASISVSWNSDRQEIVHLVSPPSLGPSKLKRSKPDQVWAESPPCSPAGHITFCALDAKSKGASYISGKYGDALYSMLNKQRKEQPSDMQIQLSVQNVDSAARCTYTQSDYILDFL